MQKAFTKKSDITKFKKDYTEGVIQTEVVSNLLQPYHAQNNPELEEFMASLYQKKFTSLIFMASDLGYEIMQSQFGKHDFTFEGNRKYKNYILEHEGLLFIAPLKREVVIPDIKPKDFISKLIDFEKTFLQLVITTALSKRAELDSFWQDKLTEMEENGAIINGELNFRTLPKFKM